VSKAMVTNLADGHSRGKPRVIPGDAANRHRFAAKGFGRRETGRRGIR
jgi:hypothetical protein